MGSDGGFIKKGRWIWISSARRMVTDEEGRPVRLVLQQLMTGAGSLQLAWGVVTPVDEWHHDLVTRGREGAWGQQGSGLSHW